MISNKLNLLRLASLTALALIFLAGCRGNAPAPTLTPAAVVVAPFGTEQPEPDEAVVDVDKAKGATIALQDGAQAAVPPGGLADDATLTFRTALDSPAVPVPLGLVGQAYELLVDGSELTGVASLRLPLSAGVTTDQYDVAPYRWSGRLWERVTARGAAGGVEFGVSEPGIYALLGRWRLADASLALVKPETPPGQQSIPLTVVGQYRYSAIPALEDGLVPARLVLKQDSSGGAGLVAGNPALDETVDEMTLYFKPDPAQSQGIIQFQHVFELVPGLIDVDPGVSTRFYVVMTVADAAAPTRRISSGVEYTQILPIQIQGMEVVRPVVLQEDQLRLRWKVSLNGLTFQTPDARGNTLELQPIIDQGGVGDYKIVLEVEQDGAWAPVSNELSVQLALRATATPPPGSTPTPALVAVVTPGGAIPSPAVPTRRPTPRPQAGATATPAATTTSSAATTPTPTRWDTNNVFRADKYAVAAGECTNLSWNVENVISVRFQGAGATGNETRRVCPTQTTTYTLSVTSSAGTQDYTVTIQVAPEGSSGIVFTSDKMQVAPGECANLSWSATDVREVRLNDSGVEGVATRRVCPEQTTTYTLSVLTTTGETVNRSLTITVTGATPTPTGGPASAVFYAERYALPAGGCTTLHWRVQNVQSVFLDGEGVAGVGTRPNTCPDAMTQFYTLEITDASGTVSYRDVTLSTGDPALGANEVIAQGAVVQAVAQADQAGYEVTINGILPLFTGASGFSQSQVVLRIPQAVLDLGLESGVHWPVRPGQPVEFRAMCDGSNCYTEYGTDQYLYWRAE